MTTRYSRFLSIFFCLFLGGLLAWHLLLPDRDRSDVENRTLARFPEFSWEGLKDGSFTEGVEEYFADRALMTMGVLVVDARHKPTADDCTMARWYQQSGCPFVVAANKVDKLSKTQAQESIPQIRETLSLSQEERVIPVSALKGTGRQELLQAVLDSFRE